MTNRHAAVDIASLAFFRIAFGGLLCIGALRFMAEGWIEPFFVEPHFFFKYPGFEWVTVLPRWAMYLHYSVIALSALCVALGLFYRFSLAVFVATFAYAQLIDVTNYLNHYYLVVLIGVLMLFVPAHRALSLDVWRKPELASNTAPAWSLWLLRFQLALVYVFAGVAKMEHDWLILGEPLRTWLRARNELPLIGSIISQPWAALLMSWAAMLYDTTIVLWLSWPRSRAFAFAAVLGFHTLTHVFFDIGLFPFLMTLGATLFFDPSWPRRFIRKQPPALQASHAQPHRGWWVAFALYATLQLGLPLRSHFYPGSVLWEERGMRWSWRVMVREKSGSVSFLIDSPSRGKHWVASAHDYLTWRQANEMSGQPDLIEQLARHIGDEFRTRGVADVRVHAEAWVSLNGRPAQLLLDPSINLAER